MMTKSTRRRGSDNVLTMPSEESSRVGEAASDVTEGDIARRAFELYCARGCEDGRDIDDWLNAERELRDTASSST
jgi:hypothetical protein